MDRICTTRQLTTIQGKQRRREPVAEDAGRESCARKNRAKHGSHLSNEQSALQTHVVAHVGAQRQALNLVLGEGEDFLEVACTSEQFGAEIGQKPS